MQYTKLSLASFIIISCSLFACNDTSEPTQKTTRQAGILFNNATLIDGSGSPSKVSDVLVVAGKIAQIGTIKAISEDKIIDAKGLVLAPGFIDSHSHHDEGLDKYPHATAVVSQGITTIVTGQDGYSEHSLSSLKESLIKTPAAINVAYYTPHGNLRDQVLANDYKRHATSAEVVAMQTLLEQELQNGSLGLSTGLEYDPGIYSSSDEVLALAKTAAQYNGRYISHMRSEDRHFQEALDELLSIGREANIPVQISHIKLASSEHWGKAKDVVKYLDKARQQGIDVSADIYPYSYWESTLTVLLPERDFSDLNEARYVLKNLAPADGLILTAYKPSPDFAGKTVAEIAKLWQLPEAETFLKLITDTYGSNPTHNDFDQESVMGISMQEPDIETLMAWPHTNICSDGGIKGHPRGYGAFPRALSHYSKQQNIVPLEEMIRKMTSLTASHIGISQRGLIKTGYHADLVLLDIETLDDKATIEKHNSLSTGVEGVWVNGIRVWHNNKPTQQHPGIFVKRAAL